jgi:hypothetical protein
MLVTLAISHLLMHAALTLLFPPPPAFDYSVSNISDQSFADGSSSNITFPTPTPFMTLVFFNVIKISKYSAKLDSS